MRKGERWSRCSDAQPPRLTVPSQLLATIPCSTFNNVGLPHSPTGLYIYHFYETVKTCIKHTTRRVYQAHLRGSGKNACNIYQNNNCFMNNKLNGLTGIKGKVESRFFDNGKLKYWLLDKNKGTPALLFLSLNDVSTWDPREKSKHFHVKDYCANLLLLLLFI